MYSSEAVLDAILALDGYMALIIILDKLCSRRDYASLLLLGTIAFLRVKVMQNLEAVL